MNWRGCVRKRPYPNFTYYPGLEAFDSLQLGYVSGTRYEPGTFRIWRSDREVRFVDKDMEVVVVFTIQTGKFPGSQEGLCSIWMVIEVPILRSYGMWVPTLLYAHINISEKPDTFIFRLEKFYFTLMIKATGFSRTITYRPTYLSIYGPTAL
jgi:hypothetical protein